MSLRREFPVAQADVVGTYFSLVEAFGVEDCFLLETGPGPAADSGDHIVGVGRLLSAVRSDAGDIRFWRQQVGE